MTTVQGYLDFRTAYVDALLWSTYANPEETGCSFEYFSEAASRFEDFNTEAQEHIEKDCKDFLELAEKFIPEDGFSQSGHDFALTRNGHGVGFWDREEIYGEKAAKELNKIADSFGEIYLYWEAESQTVGIE